MICYRFVIFTVKMGYFTICSENRISFRKANEMEFETNFDNLTFSNINSRQRMVGGS